MRVLSEKAIDAGDASATSVSSVAIDVKHIGLLSAHVVMGGSPVGTIKLQASNNDCASWVDTTITAAVSAAGSFFLSMPDVTAQYVRVVYTKTSGTGTVNAWVFGKGF